jgi:hypothetical protein
MVYSILMGRFLLAQHESQETHNAKVIDWFRRGP